MEYIYPKGDFISGFGVDSSYELACQKMVVAGMQWFDANPSASPKFKTYENIFGIVSDENPDAVSLTDAMNEAVKEYGATGAMMQACVSHCLYASKNGWDKYLEELTERAEKGGD
jgi:hypothetical protein